VNDELDEIVTPATSAPPVPPTAAPARTADATVAPPEHADARSARESDSLAAVLNAGLEELDADATRTFDVPGWSTMRLRVKDIHDRDREEADSPVKTIALATDAVLLLQDDEWVEVPHAWRGIAEKMGRPELSTSDVIRRVLKNGARLDAFSLRIVGWMVGRSDEIEQALGK
jgi:hypothetical protein